MHSAAGLLHRQLYDYSDSWRAEGGGAVAPWQLEAWLESGLSIFRLIRRLDEHWGESIRSGSTPFSDTDAHEISGLYQTWLQNLTGPLGRLSEMESQGCALADAVEIRDAEREARGHLGVPLAAALGAGDRAAPDVPQMDQDVGRQFPA